MFTLSGFVANTPHIIFRRYIITTMNAPDRFELFVIPESKKKISMQIDTKIPNAAVFCIEREDHTLANMLRYQLLKDPRVLFAGYKVPHPLEHNFILKVQTKAGTRPADVLGEAITELIQELGTIKARFGGDLNRYNTFQNIKAASGVSVPGDIDVTEGIGHTVDMDF